MEETFIASLLRIRRIKCKVGIRLTKEGTCSSKANPLLSMYNNSRNNIKVTQMFLCNSSNKIPNSSSSHKQTPTLLIIPFFLMMKNIN